MKPDSTGNCNVSGDIFSSRRWNCLAIPRGFDGSSGKNRDALGDAQHKKEKTMEIDWAYLRKG